MPWQQQSVVVLHAGNTIINPSGSFTYSSAPAAGNLVASQAPAAGVDQFGNNYLLGVASYAAGFAAQMGGGFITMYTGTLAGGWTARATIEADATGDLFLTSSGAGIISLQGPVVFGSGTAMPSSNTNPGHQSAAPAAYSQAYEQASTNRINEIMDVLSQSKIWPF